MRCASQAAVLAGVLLASLATGQTVVRGPYLQLGTPGGVVVRWRTDVATDSAVWYGTTILLGSSATSAVQTTEHVITLSGLQPDTKYFYSVGTTAQTLAAGSGQFFHTSPVPGSPKPTRIWVLGDSGWGTPPARAVRDSYYAFTGSRHTDLWLMLGDNAYVNGTDAEFQPAVFENKYEAMLQKSVLWPAYGNHDGQSSESSTQTGPYYDIFTLPTAAQAGGGASGTEAYYSFDYANIHFVCLDSYETPNAPGSPMLIWLAADLAANTKQWTIAFWHHPPYSKGSHDSDAESELITMRENVNPILEAHGVDLVLAGHSHEYERSMLIDGHYGLSGTFGPQHVVNGGDGRIGGNGAYRKLAPGPAPNGGCVYVVMGTSALVVPNYPLDHPAMVHVEETLGSIVLDVNGDQLDLRYLRSDGVIGDHFTIVKGPSTPVERTQTLVPLQSVWKYHDLGTNLGTAWSAPGYDDTSWASGPGILGFGEPYVATTVSFGPNPSQKHPTTYFRKTFTLPFDPSLVEGVRLYANYDDGFVARLNGQFAVNSASLPYTAPSYTQLSASHEGGTYEVFAMPSSLLVPGQNVLAIEVHQTSASSTDLVLDAMVQCDAFLPYLGPAAAGNGGPGGAPADLLLLNGSSGGVARSIDLPGLSSLTIGVAPPPPAPSADFAIFGFLGDPGPADVFALPFGIGSMCFPPSLLALAPNLAFVASTFGPDPTLLLPATPAPWSLTLYPGAPPGFTAALQGVILDGSSAFRVTNAVRINVVP
jgi:Calcineurin-like phosphoesterase